MGALPRTIGEELCLDFVNSRYTLHRTGSVEDRLPQPEWQRWFLDRGGFDLEEAAVPLQAVAQARGAVRGVLERWAERGRLSADDAAVLDRLLAAAPGTRRVVPLPGGPAVDFEPRRRDWRWVVAEVAASAARLAAGGEAARLKACGNPNCSWLFYDQSHNASRRWCDVATCGNLVKVREFRARRRAAAR